MFKELLSKALAHATTTATSLNSKHSTRRYFYFTLSAPENCQLLELLVILSHHNISSILSIRHCNYTPTHCCGAATQSRAHISLNCSWPNFFVTIGLIIFLFNGGNMQNVGNLLCHNQGNNAAVADRQTGSAAEMQRVSAAKCCNCYLSANLSSANFTKLLRVAYIYICVCVIVRLCVYSAPWSLIQFTQFPVITAH